VQNKIRQLTLGIIRGAVLVEDGVVPVVSAHEVRVLEWRLRPRSVHHAAATGLVQVERTAVISAYDLVGLATTDEVVVAWVKRKENANASVLIGLEDEYVAIGIGPELDLRVVTSVVLTAVIEGDGDWRGGAIGKGSRDRN